MKFTRMGLNTGLFLALAVAAMGAVQAQQIYRIVGPDGRVMFTDRAPDPAIPAKVITLGGSLAAGTVNTVGLPFELQQLALKYPVVLYTANNCDPCAQARGLLTSRGVPFAEKTVTTQLDIEAYNKLSEESPLPFLTIGTQKLKGFDDGRWNQFSPPNLPTQAYLLLNTWPRGHRTTERLWSTGSRGPH
jgi:glutaredoxin